MTAKKIITVLVLLLPLAPLFSNEAYREGKKAFSRRDYEKAIPMFEKAVQYEPSNGNPYFYMGYIYEKKKDPEQAIEYFKRAVRLQMDPDLRQKAYWKIVLHYKFTEDWDNLLLFSEEFQKINQSEEIKRLKSLAEEKGGGSYSEVTLTDSGNRKLDEGDTEGALKNYRAALRSNPGYEPALWKISIVQMSQFEYDEASHNLGRLVSIRPDSWEYRYKLAICKYHLNHYEDSISDFKRARELNSTPDGSFRHYSAIGEALALLEMGETVEALQNLKEALDIKESAIGYGALARAYANRGKEEESVKVARRALDIEVDQKDALIALAEVEYARGNETQARLLLGRLIKQIRKERLVRSQERSMLLFAVLSSVERDYNSAYGAFELIRPAFINDLRLQKIPRPAQDTASGEERFITNEDYEYHYGKTLLNKKLFDEAIAHLERAKSRGDADYLLAACHAELDNENDALFYIKKAIESDSSFRTTAFKDSHFRKLMENRGDFFQFISGPSSEVIK